MARLGFTDCWAEAGRPGLVGTCRSVIMLGVGWLPYLSMVLWFHMVYIYGVI